jgi:nucleoside 2-deoxyribosyltransferase
LEDDAVDEFDQFACLLDHSDIDAARTEVSSAVQSAIDAADLVFAWIDGPDCYGTILEIGYARAVNKAVVVAFSNEFSLTKAAQEMWLLTKWGYYVEDNSPKEAWEQFWRLVESESGFDERLAKVRKIKHVLKNRPMSVSAAAGLLERMVDIARSGNLDSGGDDGTQG